MAPNDPSQTVPHVVDVVKPIEDQAPPPPKNASSKRFNSDNMSVSSGGNNSSSNQPQPRRLRCMEPDLTVIVGSGKHAQEFQHISALLCASCEYFDTLLANSRKDGETRRISFPNKDPEGWKLLFPHLEHNTVDSMKIHKSQAARLLVWFDFLCMPHMADKCDTLLIKRVMESLEPEDQDNENGGTLDENILVAWWEICDKLPCPKTKQALRQLLLDMDVRRQLKGRKTGQKVLIKLMPILKQDAEIRQAIFSQIFVPQAVRDMPMKELLDNPLLDHFLTARVLLGKRELVGCVKLCDGPKVNDDEEDDTLGEDA